jgi:hypothetical protein
MFCQFLNNDALLFRRLPQDSMKCDNDWHSEILNQVQNMGAGVSTKDTVFMLKNGQIKFMDIEKIGCTYIIGLEVSVDLEFYTIGVVIPLQDIIHGNGDEIFPNFFCLPGQGITKIRCKCGDSTLPGQIVADYRYFCSSTQRILQE